MIKEPNRSKVDMRTLETLIVTDVHSMDVTQQIMEKRVKDIN